MVYKCQICDYETDDRNKIDYHHIVSKELNGNNKKSNKIYVCPTCHRLIYIPESKTGCHSVRTEESITIYGWYMSTGGRVLHYNKNHEDFFVEDKN
jgi:uncharacterized protein YlaI